MLRDTILFCFLLLTCISSPYTAAQPQMCETAQELQIFLDEATQAGNRKDYVTAKQKLEQGLKRARELNLAQVTAPFIGNAGLIYETLGEPQKAIALHQEALARSRQDQDVTGIASNLLNLALVYNNLDDHQTALKHYEEVLPRLPNIPDKALVANIFNNLGNTYDKLGYTDKAIGSLEKAVSIHRELKHPPEVIVGPLMNLGVAYSNMDDHESNRSDPPPQDLPNDEKYAKV